MLDIRFQEQAAPALLSAPRVLLWDARAAYVGPSMRLSPHRNAAATVALALDQPFALTLFEGPRPSTKRTRHALIPPGTRHHIDAEGRMAFIYLDALSDELDGLSVIGSQPLPEPRRNMSAEAMVSWLSGAAGLRPRTRAATPLTAVVRAIDKDPARFTTAAQAAALAGLSSSRFQHALRKAVGVPFRRYRLWRRMGVVARALGKGESLTTAAHEAGFSSSAHLSAAFRTMFGIAPSKLLATRAKIEWI